MQWGASDSSTTCQKTNPVVVEKTSLWFWRVQLLSCIKQRKQLSSCWNYWNWVRTVRGFIKAWKDRGEPSSSRKKCGRRNMLNDGNHWNAESRFIRVRRDEDEVITHHALCLPYQPAGACDDLRWIQSVGTYCRMTTPRFIGLNCPDQNQDVMEDTWASGPTPHHQYTMFVKNESKWCHVNECCCVFCLQLQKLVQQIINTVWLTLWDSGAVEWSVHMNEPSQRPAVNYFRIIDRC